MTDVSMKGKLGHTHTDTQKCTHAHTPKMLLRDREKSVTSISE